MVTFVNAKQEVKCMPLNGTSEQVEGADRSLYKRLQYAKDILVQMMSAQSLPQELAPLPLLNNPAT